MHVFFYRSASGKSPVKKYINGLPRHDQAKFSDVFDGISVYGLEFDSLDFMHLRGKLWEIKFTALGGGYRIIYVMVEQDVMLWLHAFKKDSQKTPPQELSLALRRMKEMR
jgi:phage-related protein